jgi:hypothetical protein
MFMGSEESYARIGWLISFQFDVGTRIFLNSFQNLTTSFFYGDFILLW